MRRPSRQPQQQTVQAVRLAAPIGGINAVAPAAAMPETDCMLAWNVIPDQRGLRVRLGYQEHVTGLTGAANNLVPSLLPFGGGALSGSSGRLFAVTSSGIWDVSTSTASPTVAIAFGNSTGLAGHGIAHACSTPAGRFLLYCDEENGLFIYSEATGAWSQVTAGVTQLWDGGEFYSVGNHVVNGGNVYVCATGGTSDPSGSGPSGTGSAIPDGSTVLWNYVSAASSGVIGPSLADQNAGFTADPANFAYVTVWKSRLWFVEKNSSRAWYLGVNSIYGTATSFDFGSRMKTGGALVGLYSWSYDGGGGLDAFLVGISMGGDVVIYAGTDPSSVSTFGLKGVWSVAGVPAGRRIATDTGGDLLVLSLLGVVPLSRLVVGGESFDQSQYATAKIGPVFARLAQLYGGFQGWDLAIHPSDNALIVTVPTSPNGDMQHLAMSFASKGWFQYRGLPLLSAAIFNRELYFGTADGRVCRNTGYVDDLKLANQNDFDAIDYSFLTSYQHLGTPTQRMVTDIRPIILAEMSSPAVTVSARYDYSLAEATSPPGNTGDNPPATTALDTNAGQAVLFVATISGFEGTTQITVNPDGPTEETFTIYDRGTDYLGTGKAYFVLTDPTANAHYAGEVVREYVSAPGSSTWGLGAWDAAVWGADYDVTQSLHGTTGVGRAVAIAVRGNAIARTTFAGFDVYVKQGGIL